MNINLLMLIATTYLLHGEIHPKMKQIKYHEVIYYALCIDDIDDKVGFSGHTYWIPCSWQWIILLQISDLGLST